MANINKILEKMKRAPHDVRFDDLAAACEHFFGEARQEGTSHKIFKTPWEGDPRVNIQEKNGKGKGYQVKQVLAAIKKLQGGAK